MKITRTVNGESMTFELTGWELWDAYEEQQHIYDMDGVRNWIEGCGETPEEQKWLDEHVEDMAYEMRRMMDKYDCDQDYACEEVYEKCLKEMREANAI